MESLFLNKLFENPILCGHQCIECAQLGHCALVQHHNLVGVFDGGQAVGNDEHGVAAFCQQSVQRFSDLDFFLVIKNYSIFFLVLQKFQLYIFEHISKRDRVLVLSMKSESLV